MKKREFTPEEISEIQAGWKNSGKSEGQIYLMAELYDCTPNDVRAALGLKPGNKRADNKNPHTDSKGGRKGIGRIPEAEAKSKREAVRSALLAGSAIADAAEQAEVSCSTVCRIKAQMVRDGLLEPKQTPEKQPEQVEDGAPERAGVAAEKEAVEPAKRSETDPAAVPEKPAASGTDTSAEPSEELPAAGGVEEGKETPGGESEDLQIRSERPVEELPSAGLRMLKEAYRMKRASSMLTLFEQYCADCMTPAEKTFLTQLREKAERFADGVAWAGRTLCSEEREEIEDAERKVCGGAGEAGAPV